MVGAGVPALGGAWSNSANNSVIGHLRSLGFDSSGTVILVLGFSHCQAIEQQLSLAHDMSAPLAHDMSAFSSER